jgi:hypothetical protein
MTMAKPLYIIRNDHGTGGFLAPPGHPSHFYSVEGYYGGRIKPVSGPDLIAGLDYLLANEYGDVPADVKAQAQRIMDAAVLTCSEMWVRSVYGHFRNSYSPDGTDRNVSDAVRSGPADHHLGYLMVRSYFPDHSPRTDLITDPGKGYGSYPCVKCGTRVQYEARYDAFCEVRTSPWRWIPECPSGGSHEIEG